MVSRSFEALIPTILLGTLSGFVAYLFSLTSFGNLHQLIFTIVQTPLQGVGSSIWAVMLIIAFQQFLWFLGYSWNECYWTNRHTDLDGFEC